MSIKLVRKSLIKFLQENLTDIKVTDNSNLSTINSITKLYSKRTLDPSKSSDIELTGTVDDIIGVQLTGIGTLFESELSVGDSIKINGVIGLIETIYNDTTLDFTEILPFSVLGGESIYTPSSKQFILLQENSRGADNFNTSDDITGYSISANGESKTILDWDNTTSQITLPSVFSDEVLGWDSDLEVGTELDISLDYLLYVKSPHYVNDQNSDYHSFGQRPRWDMYLKVKDDSDRDKIESKLQEIRDILFNNRGNFPIYNELQTEIVANSQMIHGSYEEKELVDNNNDLQSILISFIGRYWMNYIK